MGEEKSAPEWRITHDETGFDCHNRTQETFGARWKDVRRFGYWTEDTGLAITDDYFLALDTSAGLYLISMEIPGALSVSEWLKRQFKCTFGPKGNLCHSTVDDSVIVWPENEAGLELVDVVSRVTSGGQHPVTYLCVNGGMIRAQKLFRAL